MDAEHIAQTINRLALEDELDGVYALSEAFANALDIKSKIKGETFNKQAFINDCTRGYDGIVNGNTQVFSVDGYFHNDNSTFTNYLITEEFNPAGYKDDEIFFHGVSEDMLKTSMAGKAMFADFTVTAYRIVEGNK